jgi:ABC-type glycerol-3-phosphate transport system permease component
MYPLQLVLRGMLLSSTLADPTMSQLVEQPGFEFLVEQMKYALIVVSSIPVLILYPFVQKHFVQGVMIGAIKG